MPIDSFPDMVHLIICPSILSKWPLKVFKSHEKKKRFSRCLILGLKSTKLTFSHFQLHSSNAIFSGLELKNFKCKVCSGVRRTSLMPDDMKSFSEILNSKQSHRITLNIEYGFKIHSLRCNIF